MKLHRESFVRLQELFDKSEIRTLTDQDKYVIFSDFHIGNGTRSDDFKQNASLTIRVLEEYYDQGYHLILNGDVEELQRFSLTDIHESWPEIFALFSAFSESGRLTKLYGNHDFSLLREKESGFRVFESLRFDYHGNSLFVFHGHQTIRFYYEESALSTFLLRHIATPLGIKNKSVSHSSSKRFTTEKRVYHFSSLTGVLSIIGHTHRPLFESMSKLDSLRFEIERLCRKYPRASTEKKGRIEERIGNLKKELARLLERDDKLDNRRSLYDNSLVVPCLFNSGAVIAKNGITNLVIENGEMALVHWFDRQRRKRVKYSVPYEAKQLAKSSIYSVEMKRDSLDYIFSRIRLLGGSGLRPGKSVNIDDRDDLSSAV
ncbi:MAG: metallophosphoesterase [Spirochaetales bacterium]|nr:metallophosphoesterase [Spirochaetales bacterium]